VGAGDVSSKRVSWGSSTTERNERVALGGRGIPLKRAMFVVICGVFFPIILCFDLGIGWRWVLPCVFICSAVCVAADGVISHAPLAGRPRNAPSPPPEVVRYDEENNDNFPPDENADGSVNGESVNGSFICEEGSDPSSMEELSRQKYEWINEAEKRGYVEFVQESLNNREFKKVENLLMMFASGCALSLAKVDGNELGALFLKIEKTIHHFFEEDPRAKFICGYYHSFVRTREQANLVTCLLKELSSLEGVNLRDETEESLLVATYCKYYDSICTESSSGEATLKTGFFCNLLNKARSQFDHREIIVK